MVYSADNPEDNFQHNQFHQHFLESIKFVVKPLYSVTAGLFKIEIVLYALGDDLVFWDSFWNRICQRCAAKTVC